ncbi:MAG: hypothetical protein GY929_15335 [Actinomycetia bacterium]|nr:hypothetical protein [Actinomycetes bacterium]
MSGKSAGAGVLVLGGWVVGAWVVAGGRVVDVAVVSGAVTAAVVTVAPVVVAVVLNALLVLGSSEGLEACVASTGAEVAGRFGASEPVPSRAVLSEVDWSPVSGFEAVVIGAGMVPVAASAT